MFLKLKIIIFLRYMFLLNMTQYENFASYHLSGENDTKRQLCLLGTGRGE